MTRHVPHTRHPSKPLRVRIQFSVTLTPDERDLLTAWACNLGYDFDGGDERTVLRRLLQDHGLNAIQEAAEQVRYELPEDDDGDTGDFEEGGDA